MARVNIMKRVFIHYVYIDLAKLPKKFTRSPGTVRICGRFVPFDGYSVVKPAVIYERDYCIVKRYFEALATSYRRKEQFVVPPFIIWKIK